jgi:hypothetical protein
MYYSHQEQGEEEVFSLIQLKKGRQKTIIKIKNWGAFSPFFLCSINVNFLSLGKLEV